MRSMMRVSCKRVTEPRGARGNTIRILRKLAAWNRISLGDNPRDISLAFPRVPVFPVVLSLLFQLMDIAHDAARDADGEDGQVSLGLVLDTARDIDDDAGVQLDF